jgi:S1-C subfamily serine protease
VLYPIVRVRTEKAGGSGTILYSKLLPDHNSEYETYVLTNHHVIADCIKVNKKWDSVAKRNMDKEFLTPCTVEIFSYVYMSRRDSGQTFEAKIVAYDENHDLALLRLDSPTPAKHVANIYPRDRENEIKLFSDVWCSGCSLGHEPLVNKGQITSLRETIDNKLYWMGNAHSIFGNSGGAIFLAKSGEFIGVPSRITAVQLGFGMDIITWMGFFVPIIRLYEFLDEQELKFIYDENVTSTECFKRREEKMEDAKRRLMQEEDSGRD